MDPVSPYNALIDNGTWMLPEQCGQVLNLAVALSKEMRSHDEMARVAPGVPELPQGEDASLVTVRAFKASILALLSDILETLANLVGGLAVQLSEGGTANLRPAQRLSQVELDFLLDQQTVLDTRSGAVRTPTPRFSPVADKLALAPVMLARVHGVEYAIDKSSTGWRRFRAFKDARNALTHPRVASGQGADAWHRYHLDADYMRPGIRVTVTDVADAISSVVWYSGTVAFLLVGDGEEPDDQPQRPLAVVQATLALALLNLSSVSNMLEEEFEARYQYSAILSGLTLHSKGESDELLRQAWEGVAPAS